MIICIVQERDDWSECSPYFIDTNLLENNVLKNILESKESVIDMYDSTLNIFTNIFNYEDFMNDTDRATVGLPQMVEKYLTLDFNGEEE